MLRRSPSSARSTIRSRNTQSFFANRSPAAAIAKMWFLAASADVRSALPSVFLSTISFCLPSSSSFTQRDAICFGLTTTTETAKKFGSDCTEKALRNIFTGQGHVRKNVNLVNECCAAGGDPLTLGLGSGDPCQHAFSDFSQHLFITFLLFKACLAKFDFMVTDHHYRNQQELRFGLYPKGSVRSLRSHQDTRKTC